MNYKSTITASILAVACLLSSIQTEAAAPRLTTAQLTILGSLFASTYLLFARQAVKDAEPQYSVAKLGDLKNLFTKEYFGNIWRLYYDGFVGQLGKGSTKAFGVLGTIAGYTHPLKKASGALAYSYLLYRIARSYNKNPDAKAADKARRVAEKYVVEFTDHPAE